MADRKHCVITVWLALSLAVITGLFLALLESARTASQQWYLEFSARQAADSLFADYHRELWERYRVFGLEEYSGEEIRDELYGYLAPYADRKKNHSWVDLSFSPEKITVMKTETLLSENGRPLKEEILSFMRTAWITDGSPAADAEALLHKAQTERTEEDVSEWIGGLCEAGTDMAGYSLSICEEADLLRQKKRHLIRDAEDGDGAGFSERSSEMELGAKKILSLAEKCREASERYDAGTASRREEAADTAELRRKLVTLTADVRQLLKDLTAAEELSEAAQREEETEEDADSERLSEIREEAVTAAEGITLPEEIWSRRSGDPEKLSRLEKAGDLLSGGLLELLLPEGTVIREEPISIPEAPSAQAYGAGALEVYPITDRLLLSEYVLRTTLYYEKENSGKELQAEYVTYGRENDRENIAAAVGEGMAIRTGSALMALICDSTKRKEAEALSAAVTGGMPGTMEAVTFVILALWAAWQAASDIRVLLAGGKVPAFRQASEFTVSLSDVLSGMLPERNSETGLSSRDCLRLLLAMHMDDARVLRMADVMQHELMKTQEDFRMKRMVTEFSAVIGAESQHVFSVGGTYEMQTAAGRSYD